MEKGKGIKYRVGDLIRESGLPRIRHLMNKYKFSKRGKWIAPSLVLLFFLNRLGYTRLLRSHWLIETPGRIEVSGRKMGKRRSPQNNI